MQLTEIVQKVLETGELPMRLERQLYTLLGSREFDEIEIAALDQLMEALCKGTIRSVPNK